VAVQVVLSKTQISKVYILFILPSCTYVCKLERRGERKTIIEIMHTPVYISRETFWSISIFIFGYGQKMLGMKTIQDDIDKCYEGYEYEIKTVLNSL